MIFWILWGWDVLIASVFVYFFFIGLADGSVSSFNIKLWLGTLSILAGIIGASLWLQSKKYSKTAKGLLLMFAIPGFLYCLFFLIVFMTNPRWN